jgi:hypothetical protein
MLVPVTSVACIATFFGACTDSGREALSIPKGATRVESARTRTATYELWVDADSCRYIRIDHVEMPAPVVASKNCAADHFGTTVDPVDSCLLSGTLEDVAEAADRAPDPCLVSLSDTVFSGPPNARVASWCLHSPTAAQLLPTADPHSAWLFVIEDEILSSHVGYTKSHYPNRAIDQPGDLPPEARRCSDLTPWNDARFRTVLVGTLEWSHSLGDDAQGLTALLATDEIIGYGFGFNAGSPLATDVEYFITPLSTHLIVRVEGANRPIEARLELPSAIKHEAALGITPGRLRLTFGPGVLDGETDMTLEPA